MEATAAKGHDDHANKEVHRPLMVVAPLLKGPDIAELQTSVNSILHGIGLHGVLKVDGEFGERSADLTNDAAYAYGLEAAGDSPHHITRIVTQDEQHLLRNPDSRTDAQKERSKRRIPDMLAHQEEQSHTNPSSIRAKVLEYCQWGVDNNGNIHYSQVRPMDYMTDLKHLPIYDDCSEYATKAAKYAGAPDPNGLNYNGSGYTGTMLQHCKHIAKAEALPADLCVYGSFPGMHVVLLKDPGSVSDPNTYSHGQEAGPMIVRHSAEVAAHGGAPVSFLRYL